MSTKHHSVFYKFPKWKGYITTDNFINFLGISTKKFYHIANYKDNYEKQFVETDYPSFDEEYFEWIDLLESVLSADKVFTMIELGAGYGRWITNGAKASLIYNKDYNLTGVEAEPSHFIMMKDHIQSNLQQFDNITLIEAAVSDNPNDVLFITGHPEDWYGQSIVKHSNFKMQDFPDTKVNVVKAITLEEILKKERVIDLIDIDIQGYEFKVLDSSKEYLNNFVKKIHIGTHSAEIEESLRYLFDNMGWFKKYDFECNKYNITDFGEIHFQDGIQTWINSAFNRLIL